MKLCNENHEVGFFCRLLQADDTIHVKEILDYFVEKYPVQEMERHYHCSQEHCGMKVFTAFYDYFKIYRDVPEFQDKINDPEFPVKSLERLVHYLIFYRDTSKETLETVMDQYLYFLDPDRIVGLISETDLIVNQPIFTLHCMGLLDNRHMDALLARSDRMQKRLTELFLNAPEANIGSILAINPVIYDYIIMFLELAGQMDESENFQKTYGNIVQSANQVKELVHQIESLDRSTDKANRALRILTIVEGINEFKDPGQALAILSRNRVFLDQEEEQVINRLTMDRTMMEFLNLAGSGVRIDN